MRDFIIFGVNLLLVNDAVTPKT